MNALRSNSLLAGVIAPAVAAVALLALLIGAVLHISTSRSDALAVQRQDKLVRVALEQSVMRVGIDQEASTLWDDSIENLRAPKLDFDWLDNNLGVWFHTYYRHDETYLLDPAGRPIYAMRNGDRSGVAAFGNVQPIAAPLASKLRPRLLAGYWAPEGSESQTLGEHEISVVAGRPAIVSVKPIVSDTGKIVQRPGTEFLHISVRYLDGSFLKELSNRYGIDGARFSWTPGGQASVPLTGSSGRIIGYFAWQPFRPGAQVADRMVPALGLALLLIGGVIVVLRLSERRSRLRLQASRREAQHLAFHDTLTGLPNRALFDDRLEQALLRRNRPAKLGILMLDIDRFKHINDALGHAAGDAVIRGFGARLVGLLRPDDTVARLGGDEFAVLVDDLDAGQVTDLCARILETVALPLEIGGTHVYIGVSIGVALAPDAGLNGPELLRKADIALYSAKDDGRSCFRLFSPDMDETVQRRSLIEEELRQSLASGEGLRLHYQPLVDTKSLRIVGLEALVRWQHPSRGLIPPEQFVAVAEETGLIIPLSNWVIREACRTAAKWPHLFMAINLSPVQFRTKDFPKQLLAMVSEAGANPCAIELEVTERVLLTDEQAVGDCLAALRRHGFRIVLDDFGTGYSSLSHLRSFRLDKIKIDRSFVQHLGVQRDCTAIVSAVVSLGHAMGIAVAAEGVETEAQRDFLRVAGCDQMQGYLFATALPLEQLVEFAGMDGTGSSSADAIA